MLLLGRLLQQTTPAIVVYGVSCFLLASQHAGAHTVQICHKLTEDGNISLLAGTYHPLSQGIQGGAIVDGTTYNFTGSVLSTDGYTCSAICSGQNPPPPVHWQEVKIEDLPFTNHTVTTTATTAVEAPWPFGCFPMTLEFGCQDDDGDGICNKNDVCPNDALNDADGDGVCGDIDRCADTTIPEISIPSERLGTNRFALVDDDIDFDTTSPQGKGPERLYSTISTAGCSCEQIVEELELGQGHSKFGCSISAMDAWVDFVNGAQVSDLE